MRRALAALVTGWLLPAPALGCALELILAVDVSGSVDRTEYALQMGGMAAAFEDEGVIEAIGRLPDGMLVTVTQWSGISRQRQVTGWAHLTGADSARAFAAEIRAIPRLWQNYSTAIGEALLHAGAISSDAPRDCLRRVVDISGDGVSNEGATPGQPSRGLVAQGYTINGLVIRGAEPDPVEQYQDEVVGGHGAFLEIANSFDDYPRAIRAKLLREIDQPLLVSETAPGTPSSAE